VVLSSKLENLLFAIKMYILIENFIAGVAADPE
jgi:hypothetical protein